MILWLLISTLKYLTSAVSYSSGSQLTRCVLAVTNGAFELALATVDHCKSGVATVQETEAWKSFKLKLGGLFFSVHTTHIEPNHTNPAFE